MTEQQFKSLRQLSAELGLPDPDDVDLWEIGSEPAKSADCVMERHPDCKHTPEYRETAEREQRGSCGCSCHEVAGGQP